MIGTDVKVVHTTLWHVPLSDYLDLPWLHYWSQVFVRVSVIRASAVYCLVDEV